MSSAVVHLSVHAVEGIRCSGYTPSLLKQVRFQRNSLFESCGRKPRFEVLSMPIYSTPMSVNWRRWDKSEDSVSGVTWLNNSSSTVLSYTNTVDKGGPIPDFRRRIALLLSATSPLTGRDVRYTSSGQFSVSGTFRSAAGVKATNSIYGDIGANMGTPIGPTLTLTRSDNIALMDFVSKASNALTQLQAGVCFGELGETLRMIRNPARSIWLGMRDYLSSVEKRGRKRRNKKELVRIVSDTWLEYSFGWRPFLSDAEDAAKALAQFITRVPIHRVVVGKGAELIKDSSSVGTLTYSNIRVNRLITSGQSAEVRYKGCLRTADVPFSGSLAPFGLTPWDLAPTIWELIPYSFLVDYFSNVGNIIAGASFNRANLAWCEKGTALILFREAEFDSGTVLPLGSGWTLVSKTIRDGGKARYEDKRVNRSVYTGSFIPSLEFTIPGLGLKWLNIAALIGSSRGVSRRLAS